MAQFAAGLLAFILSAVAALPAAAQSYPSRQVRIIVPFAAGGPADIYARVLAQHLQQALGQPFVVEDRPGGGSIVGTDVAAKADPDGYTLLMMSNTHTVNESLRPHKPFQLMRDFVPVAPVNYSDLVLVVNPSVPVNTLKDLIALAKAKPHVLNYASSGPGTPYHMAGELFKAMAGLDIVHVPYKGSSGARTDVLGGQVQMMFDAITTMAPHVRAGQAESAGHHRQNALAGAAGGADDVRGRRARLRGGDLARHHGAQGHAHCHRPAAERGDQEDREQPRGETSLGQAGGDADEHEHR